MKIPIIFGWLHFHRKEQLCLSKYPILVCHWRRASWMNCDLYSKRLFCIGKDDLSKAIRHEFDAYWERE